MASLDAMKNMSLVEFGSFSLMAYPFLDERKQIVEKAKLQGQNGQTFMNRISIHLIGNTCYLFFKCVHNSINNFLLRCLVYCDF